MKPVNQIVLVGHCGFDASTLHRAMEQVVGEVGEASVREAHSRDELETLGGDALLLINRQLEPGFDAKLGQELIRDLANEDDPPVLMLISSQAEAQREAMEAGALRGFGKAEVNDAATRQRLGEVIAGTAAGTEEAG